MWRSAKFASTFGFAVIAMTSGAALKAQEISTNPYHMNYNWDKLQAQKIGVASGIRMDPDGKHPWMLDRCSANGSADSDLDPISELDMDGKMVQSFGKGLMSFPHGFFIDHERNVWVTDGAPEGDPRAESGLKRHLGHQVYRFSPTGKLLMTLGTAGVAGAKSLHFARLQCLTITRTVYNLRFKRRHEINAAQGPSVALPAVHRRDSAHLDFLRS